MNLTPEEQAIMNGERGRGPRRAMELLVALGRIYGAGRLIPIKSAQVSGVSYMTIGDAGLEFIRDFARDSKVSVLTTLNPAGVDLDNWERTGFTREFYEKQKAIIDTYAAMGIRPTCTCTPYYIGNRPSKGDHLAWGESSAVSFANSVLGARTNREGGPGALAAAIVGKTPEYGLHLDENRRATVMIEIDEGVGLHTVEDFAVLGNLAGGMRGGRGEKILGAMDIPYFTGMDPGAVREEHLKALGAAMAATGSVALYHVEGITPEYKEAITYEKRSALEERIVHIDADMLAAHRDALSGDFVPHLIAIGCPHLSPGEMEEVADLLDTIPDEKINRNVSLWVHVSRKLRDENPGLARRIGRVGEIVSDTCMVVAPISDERYRERPFRFSATNSGKAVRYLATLGDQQVRFMGLDEMVEIMGNPGLMPATGEREGSTCIERKAPSRSDNRYTAPRASSMPCRPISPGVARGKVMRCNTPISFLGDVNLETGIIENPDNNHCGETVAGKILVFPNGVGSTVGSFVMYSLAKRGAAPAAIVNTEAETIVATGAIIGGIPMVDSIDFHFFRDGERVEIDAVKGVVRWLPRAPADVDTWTTGNRSAMSMNR